MNEVLLGELAEFLEASNIALQRPNISSVTIYPDGKYGITAGSHIRTNYNDLASKYNIVILLSFSALDALLDYWHPSLTSSGFMSRLKALPETTPIERVIYNSYRVIMALRNTLVHDKTGIGASASGVQLGTDAGVKKFVSCGAKGISALITIIYLLLKNPNLKDKYSEMYLVALHDRLLSDIGGRYRDSVESNLDLIGGDLNFALGERKQFEHSLSSESEIQTVELNRYPKILTSVEPTYRDQFLFRWAGKISVIPGEVLDSEASLKPHHLDEWLIEPGCTLARH